VQKFYQMRLSWLTFIFLPLLIISGCKKDETGDPNYPTTITRATSAELDQLLIKLSKTPLYECTSIDSFGYCYVSLKNKSCGKFDSVYVHYSEKEIVNLFYQSVFNYRDLLHLTDTFGIKVSSIKTLKGNDYSNFYANYPDSIPQGWIVTSNFQTIGGFQIPNTEIRMLIEFDQVRSISGKRYEQLYVPSTDVFSEKLAKESLINVELSSGNYTLKPDANTYWYPSEKIVFPVIKSGGIELRICWALFPKNWEVIVDSQMGEVLYSYIIG
jgi:hypothetical protein